MITLLDCSLRVRCNPETLRRCIRAGELPAVLIARRYFIEEADFARFVRARRKLAVEDGRRKIGAKK
jgi:hypothetical protein